MEVNERRIKRVAAVGSRMRKIVKENPEIFNCSPDEAFFLGAVHDIGLLLSEEKDNPAHTGGLFLMEQGYQSSKEVYFHGVVQYEYSSPLLDLLNFVDYTTDEEGNEYSLKQRTTDLHNKVKNNEISTPEFEELMSNMSFFTRIVGSIRDSLDETTMLLADIADGVEDGMTKHVPEEDV